MLGSSTHASHVAEAEERALALRSKLGLGSDALADVFELLDHLGLTVVRCPMGVTGPDGFYLRRGDLAIVAVNSAKELGHQRLTACHELAHHLFDQRNEIDADVWAGRTVPERRANVFAAFFLMPRDGVRRWLVDDESRGSPSARLDVAIVVQLAQHFGVSYEATLLHLRDLGWVSQREGATLMTAQAETVAGRLGYDLVAAQRERNRLVLPRDFVCRALDAYGRSDISLARLAELLRTDEASAREIASAAGVSPADVAFDNLVEDARHA
jgi:Zn-dependent peptidase ImmA (M78 family)